MVIQSNKIQVETYSFSTNKKEEKESFIAVLFKQQIQNLLYQ